MAKTEGNLDKLGCDARIGLLLSARTVTVTARMHGRRA